ncbi:hypothetical protein ABI59_01365 [Acidobacteria bacterium Mor1]|nr:hypothetical protein ABI59_01365 [Acidobacteria bacterium Mor1]
MNSSHGSVTASSRRALLPLPAVCLLGFLPLFPPESHGLAALPAAILLLLLLLIRLDDLTSGPWFPVLLLGLLGAWPLSAAAAAPGETVPFIALWGPALLLGVCCSRWARSLAVSEWVPRVLALATLGIGAYALWQSLGGLAAQAEAATGAGLPDAVLERLREGRAFARFSTPAALGGFLILVAPLLAVHGWTSRGGARGLSLAALSAAIAGLLAAASATAVAALAGAGALWGLRRVTDRRILAAGAAAVVLALALIVGLRGEGLWNPSAEGSPWKLRAGNFRIATEMIADRPLIGAGPGGFGEVYPGYRRPGDNETQHAHNLPLELCADLGLPLGILMSAGFFAFFLGPLLRRGAVQPVGWQQGASIGLAAFALHNLADFTAFLPSILWSAAILAGLCRVRGPAGDDVEARPAAEAGLSRAGRWALVGAGLLVALVSVGGGLAAEARWKARLAAGSGDRPAALMRLERAVRLAPWEFDGWIERASLLAAPDASQDALRAALRDIERGLRVNPARPSGYALRATLRYRLGDLPGAYTDMGHAAELYPLQPMYRRDRERLAGEVSRMLPTGGR